MMHKIWQKCPCRRPLTLATGYHPTPGVPQCLVVHALLWWPSGLGNVGSEKFQPPEREGRLESSAPEDTLRNDGAATSADVGTIVPIPLKVPQLKLVKDITSQTTTPKRVGGTAALIPPRVPQLKLVKDITLRMATPKPAGCTINTDDGTDAPIPPKVPCVKLVNEITLQIVTTKPAGTAANADNGTPLPIAPKVPQLKLVKDNTSQAITPNSASAAANSDYGTTVPTTPKMPELKLGKDITLHTATPKTVNTVEKAVQQKKRKANNDIGESPAARLKLNIDDVPPRLSARLSESSTLCCLSKAVLMDNLRSLTKLDLDDEAPGMLPTSMENTPHFLSRAELMDNLRDTPHVVNRAELMDNLRDTPHVVSRAELMDNLRALAKNHNLSDVSINNGIKKRTQGQKFGFSTSSDIFLQEL